MSDKGTVLVIDDEEVMREILESLLTQEGYRVKLAGAVPKFVLADDTTGFRLTPAMVESAITPRTRLLILNSPSNPTGAVYSRAELEAIVAVALKHNLYILSDEMY
jgi:aspartate aminotransferase